MSMREVFSDAFVADFNELLECRRDVRHFKPDPLEPGAIEALVALTRLGPSVGYSQPWRFVYVASADRRAAIVASFERANADALASYESERAAAYAQLKLSGLREAPVHLAVFCDGETATGSGLGARTMPETLAYSTAMAIYTFWLAARARGVGVGWVSIIEPDVVVEVLDVPSHWQLVAYLCVGYPKDASAIPELRRLGWEDFDPRSTDLLER
jgi:5,6-dimethylbenzimidazole synthase